LRAPEAKRERASAKQGGVFALDQELRRVYNHPAAMLLHHQKKLADKAKAGASASKAAAAELVEEEEEAEEAEETDELWLDFGRDPWWRSLWPAAPLVPTPPPLIPPRRRCAWLDPLPPHPKRHAATITFLLPTPHMKVADACQPHLSGKVGVALELLRRAVQSGERTLLFSQSLDTLQVLEHDIYIYTYIHIYKHILEAEQRRAAEGSRAPWRR